jgi:FkbM family methyltransferase
MNYYGQFFPPVDQVLNERLIQGCRGGFFIECGAFDGVADSNCKFLEESLGWRGINVEASPTLYEQLKKNRPNCMNVWAALSDREGTASFTTSYREGREIGLGSVIPEAVPTHEAGKAISVPTITYLTLLLMNGVTKVDLFSLDIEGHELTVLRHMLWGDLYLPELMVVEHGHVGEAPLDACVSSRYDLLFRYVNNSFYKLKS